MPTQGQLDGEVAIKAMKASVVDVLVAIGTAEASGVVDRAPNAAGTAGDTAARGRPDVEAGWTPHQVLAHVLWWHERYVKVLAAKVDRRRRPKLAGKLEDINRAGVEAHGGRTLDDLSDALRAKEHALESLVAVLYERPLAERAKLRILSRDEGTSVDLDGLVKRITDHLHGHARDIRAGTAEGTAAGTAAGTRSAARP